MDQQLAASSSTTNKNADTIITTTQDEDCTIRQEQIDQLRNRVDQVLANLIKSAKQDHAKLHEQIETLKTTAPGGSVDPPQTSNHNETELRKDSSLNDQDDAILQTAITDVVDNTATESTEKSTKQTKTEEKIWVVDPYGDQGQYEGDLLQDPESGKLPHGYGTMEYVDGRVYQGEWRKGSWNGKGKAIFGNGDSFEGLYSMDQRHGYGVYKWKVNSSYMPLLSRKILFF